MKKGLGTLLCLLAVCLSSKISSAFRTTTNPNTRLSTSSSGSSWKGRRIGGNSHRLYAEHPQDEVSRRDILCTTLAAGGIILLSPLAASAADDDEESFASIAARANKISKEISSSQPNAVSGQKKSDKTAYDFSLPTEGRDVTFADLIRQEVRDDDNSVKVKAVVVVNIKQDDPVARKTIPELISLATKYGRNRDGALAVVACPTDQGYYEPDTSALIRLKLASEYGYGINPATIVTDKVNLLGTGAVPFWRWIQATCRTPAGLGRIEGNFEKFLIDGRTGLPVRRYPRKYSPLNMADDIEALINDKQLPPAKANWMEEWRSAAAEAERDTYRFEKGLNVFDQ